MSRFSQRWRTQRNAIRNANCKTSWIIKILNAHCALGIFPWAYLSECLWTPLGACVVYDTLVAGYFGFDGALVCCLRWNSAVCICIDLEKHLIVPVTASIISSISGSRVTSIWSLKSFVVGCLWCMLDVISWSSLQGLGHCLLSNSGSQIK